MADILSCFLFNTEQGNFNLDERSEAKENKERQVSLTKDGNGEMKLKREKRDANEQMNDDQKSDDEEIALKQGNWTILYLNCSIFPTYLLISTAQRTDSM